MDPVTPNHDHPGQISWREPGEVVSSLPYLLGFHPAESLIMVAVDRDTSTLVMVGRVDLPHPRDFRAVAARLLATVANRGRLCVILIVISAPPGSEPPAPTPPGLVLPGSALAGAGLPHRALIDECTAAFAQAAIPMADAWWAAACTAQAPWRSYGDPPRTGSVPDPATSTLAPHTVLAGLVTYASRDEMDALLASDPDEVLARRSALLAARAADQRPHPAQRYVWYCGLDGAVRAAHTGVLPATDEQIVRLTLALRDRAVRDACLLYAQSELRDGAELLWRSLLRAVPGPDRAEPAALLALYAYLRGDGVLARMALQRAADADPAHGLARLLAEALSCGVAPHKLQRVISPGAIHALDEVMTSQP